MCLRLQTVCFGSFLLANTPNKAMRTDALGSAHDPLFPLNRWIQYTQTELQSIRAVVQHRYEEDVAMRRIQQTQLDSLQVQVRDLAQQQSELSERFTEVATAVAVLFHQIGVLSKTVNQTMYDVLRHFDSSVQLPVTQLAATQPDNHSL